jgi:hypothetical protein
MDEAERAKPGGNVAGRAQRNSTYNYLPQNSRRRLHTAQLLRFLAAMGLGVAPALNDLSIRWCPTCFRPYNKPLQ